MHSVPVLAVVSTIVVLIGAAAAIFLLPRVSARSKHLAMAPAPAGFHALDETRTGAPSRPETSLVFAPRARPPGRMEAYRLAFGASQLDDAVPPPH
ncbi:MAG TPA: hypothetical protein VLN59_14245, partial [Burkholderiales bacterium]|nr:hypothetical protein [Burkholderiales bacterium]